jgi:superfamily I DNA and/or RNA helicase
MSIQNELGRLISAKQSYIEELEEINKKLPELGVEGLKLKFADDLHHMDRNYVQEYVESIPECPNNENFRYASKKFLQSFHIACVTSLSIKNSFPLSEEVFDLVVIDEASQCDLVSALPMLFRAKKAVIIGDPLQLTHITSVQNYEEEFVLESLGLLDLSKRYIDTSLYDYAEALANKSKLNTVFLNEHYRCHPEIINFSNDQFYKRRLGRGMKVMTHGEMFMFGKTGLNWIPVNADMSTDKNLNVKEAEVCVALARDLRNKYPDASIGIVTPFKDQKQYIFDALRDMIDDIKVDTVHQYQGDEKDIMILSLVVTDNSPARKAMFLNRNEFLINVAITRAKSSLYIVGNWDYCFDLDRSSREKTPLKRLANYASLLNKVMAH